MPRDNLILLLMGRCRCVATPQVARWLGCSAAVARRRCAVLKNLGFLKTTVLAADQPNRYTLTRNGQKALARFTGEDPSTYRLLKAPPRQLDHHNAVVNTFV